jgi:hypothetical protein
MAGKLRGPEPPLLETRFEDFNFNSFFLFYCPEDIPKSSLCFFLVRFSNTKSISEEISFGAQDFAEIVGI